LTTGHTGHDGALPFPPDRDVDGTRVVFEQGRIAMLPDYVRELGVRRAFAVTSGGRAASQVNLPELLGENFAGAYESARQHVPVATVAESLALFHQSGADACVALGGGSAIGLGKSIARASDVPLVAVPTTYAGSEMTSIWGETGAQGKLTGRDVRVRPRLVIYDVALTLGFPARMSAASGMNAMAHAVEALYAANADTDVRDEAERAARLLARSLPRVVADGSDPEPRTGALAGAHLAGRALDRASMGLHHRICHVLGGTFGLPHAQTHAVLLPHVVAFNAPAATEAMERLGRALGVPASEAPIALSRLNHVLGVEETLRVLGLRDEDVSRAADEVLAKAYPNPRPASAEEVRGILRKAM
jgi:maleylacetate reductase